MIVLKGYGEDRIRILGTNGENAIIAGLKLLALYGTKEQSHEALTLLGYMGVWRSKESQ